VLRFVTNAFAFMCLHALIGLPLCRADGGSPPMWKGAGEQDNAHLASACWQVVIFDADHEPIGIATAFAVTEHLLATNAHVARTVATAFREGGSATVIQHDTGVGLDIVWLWTHPGYHAGESIGPDVGLLSVNETLPAILRLAEPVALRRIAAFEPVRMIGFPGDVAASIDLDGFAGGRARPRATVAEGIVTAMRPFHSLQDATPDSSLILQHDLRSVRGSSGSPILNGDGNVVAVNARGDSDLDPGVGLAVRIDVLRPFLEMVCEGALPPIDVFPQEAASSSVLADISDTSDDASVAWVVALVVCTGIVCLTLLNIARIRAKPQSKFFEAVTRFVETHTPEAKPVETDPPTRPTGESCDATR